jgi:Predicted AAA-ATPase/PD-(D/E)XK nuclease superfamily
MPLPIALGQSHFPSLREQGALYVDRSELVGAVLREGAQVQLYLRPRRFGKTLGLSLLQTWLEQGADRSHLFADLQVWQDPLARAHLHRYPVISFSLKAVKARAWVEASEQIQRALRAELLRLAPLWRSPAVPPELQAELQAALTAQRPLHDLQPLCLALQLATGERAVVLQDEYDAPLLNAWEHGHYAEAAAWHRSFLGGTLKDNPHLAFAVCTGVLQVGRESTWSDMNNVRVLDIARPRPVEPFGFTGPQVHALLRAAGREQELPQYQRWYNGYTFGGHTIYNPWSILASLQDPPGPLRPHWLHTSQNLLVRRLLLEHHELGAAMEQLLRGASIEALVDESVSLAELQGAQIWGLLLHSGYLKARPSEEAGWRSPMLLEIPNEEVRQLWERTFLRAVEPAGTGSTALERALLNGDAEGLQAEISALLRLHVSAHDLSAPQSEAFYHAFILGLLVRLSGSHHVRSNRESGLGRADLLISPLRPGLPGAVLEFKRQAHREGRPRGSLRAVARAALRQLERREYTLELEAAGAAPIHRFGVGFSGGEVEVVTPARRR